MALEQSKVLGNKVGRGEALVGLNEPSEVPLKE